MKDLMKTIGGLLFVIFSAGVIVWTASLTVQEVQSLFPNEPITPYFALALFDVGALAWLASFIYSAKGMMQRAAALLMVCFDLAGVVLMVAARIFTAGQTLAEMPQGLGNAVVYGLIGATLLNLVAIYVYHLNEPETREAIEAQTLEDKLNDEALKQARTNIEREAQQLGHLLANRTTSRIKYRLRLPMTKQEVKEWRAVSVDAETLDLPAPQDTPRVPWYANFFGLSKPLVRQSEPIILSETTESNSDSSEPDKPAS